jgi:hypothetical protein
MREGLHVFLNSIGCAREASNINRTVKVKYKGRGRKLLLLVEDSVLELFSGFVNCHG